MSTRQIASRWLIFVFGVGLTLLPGWLAVTLPGLAAGIPRLANAALAWLIMATLPAGVGRGDAAGIVYLADSAWAFSLAFWAAAGLVFGLLLRRWPLGLSAVLAIPAVLVTGWLAGLLLAAFGYSASVMP